MNPRYRATAKDRPGIVKVPWTEDQVRSLNEFQKSGKFHPFTCGMWEMTRKEPTPRDCGYLLKATPGGWVCGRENCPYTQDWAHEFMVNFDTEKYDPEAPLRLLFDSLE